MDHENNDEREVKDIVLYPNPLQAKAKKKKTKNKKKNEKSHL